MAMNASFSLWIWNMLITQDAQDAYLVLASMQAGSSSGGYSQGYAFVYGEDEYTSEDDCNDIGNGVMIWYDDVSRHNTLFLLSLLFCLFLCSHH